MKKYIFCSLLILITLPSCLSTKWYSKLNDKSEMHGNLATLNGLYANRPINYDDSLDFNLNPYPLYTLLFEPNKVYEWDEYRSYGGAIKIEAISNKKIKVSHMIGDTVLEEKIISGKLKHDIFSVKRRLRFLFLLVVNYYNEIKPSIYLDSDGNLVVYNAKSIFGNILFMSGGGDNGKEGKYKKLE